MCFMKVSKNFGKTLNCCKYRTLIGHSGIFKDIQGQSGTIKDNPKHRNLGRLGIYRDI